VFVLTEEQRHILMDYNRNELLAYQPQQPPAELGDTSVSVPDHITPATCDENGAASDKNALP